MLDINLNFRTIGHTAAFRRELQDELAGLLEIVPPEIVDHVLEHNGVPTIRCSPKILGMALRIKDLTHELNR